ncbi:hypothetical protein Y1Q_0005326 [Alligator mississippiensis]|uniref:Uncharacterized protein n=1 Tax=Alligator mississippiensis TaxID=8496 RepID=A0A151MVK7_ALLMI|nr:hypothetical protein Y1Q_0005326 [Alligator mississippiensis]
MPSLLLLNEPFPSRDIPATHAFQPGLAHATGWEGVVAQSASPPTLFPSRGLESPSLPEQAFFSHAISERALSLLFSSSVPALYCWSELLTAISSNSKRTSEKQATHSSSLHAPPRL